MLLSLKGQFIEQVKIGLKKNRTQVYYDCYDIRW